MVWVPETRALAGWHGITTIHVYIWLMESAPSSTRSSSQSQDFFKSIQVFVRSINTSNYASNGLVRKYCLSVA
jgi:hypothetical protein